MGTKTENVLVQDEYDEQVCMGQKCVYECGDCHQHFDTIEAYDVHCAECQPAWWFGGVCGQTFIQIQKWQHIFLRFRKRLFAVLGSRHQKLE